MANLTYHEIQIYDKFGNKKFVHFVFLFYMNFSDILCFLKCINVTMFVKSIREYVNIKMYLKPLVRRKMEEIIPNLILLAEFDYFWLIIPRKLNNLIKILKQDILGIWSLLILLKLFKNILKYENPKNIKNITKTLKSLKFTKSIQNFKIENLTRNWFVVNISLGVQLYSFTCESNYIIVFANTIVVQIIYAIYNCKQF